MGDEIRLDEVVAEGGAARGEGGDDVVGRIAVAPGGHRTDGDDLARVPRAGDGTVAVATGVTRRADHDHTGVPDGLHGLHQGIIGGGFMDGVAERHVDHLDVPVLLIQHQHLVESGDDVRGQSLALFIQHLHRNDGGVGGDTAVQAAGLAAVAAEDGGDVIAMAVVIVGALADQGVGVRRADVAMALEARIQHRDLHTIAGVGDILQPGQAGADRRRQAGHGPAGQPGNLVQAVV